MNGLASSFIYEFNVILSCVFRQVGNLFRDTELSRNISSLFSEQFLPDHVAVEQEYFQVLQKCSLVASGEFGYSYVSDIPARDGKIAKQDML